MSKLEKYLNESNTKNLIRKAQSETKRLSRNIEKSLGLIYTAWENVDNEVGGTSMMQDLDFITSQIFSQLREMHSQLISMGREYEGME